ncbi:hypothetical protein AGABI2DRAFT_208652 [Agaricus bisporus var. bisporus H97]|uniref:hypothetical protein n=1 Tax=Agaricus bisporus var. bisporus (strain H97 / ATCC MYA-4626 / FGSC 10389) TaxID=936046 RepID=UPI00029F602B|nr:hypothetical protein AGABI2DRAFT_208652 [Agaricus bisporus var. bisporus H97]EKV44409.1 hypothetical protein AGABI2DRAFT_208652 [Agaricus bisporus var. bisporus H97]
MSHSRDSTTYKGIPAPVPTVSLSSNNLHTRAEPISPIQDLAQRLTTDILLDKCKYRVLLRYRGDEALQILDCLQVLLDSPTLSGADRAVILKALTRLSVYSGEYPRRFKLRDVETLGNDAVDEGRYGNVWKALVHNQEVCLKVLRTYQRMPTKPLLKMLSHEALLWGQLSHPNILPFYGIYINEVRRNRFGLVSPWMENGNVVNYLKHNPDVSRLPLIHDIASGLQYLHSLNVVHGDIKGNNILVTPNGRACLADFGLSTLLGDNILDWSSLGSEADHGGGTTRWKAPELVFQEAENMDSKPTSASDVYSLACAAYEILTGQIPFFEIKGSEAVILRLFRSREQPSRPTPEKSSKELTDDVWILLECCWTHEPEERPSVGEILERLEGMMTPEQIRSLRNGGDGACGPGSVLSSSAFRQSFKKGDYELSSEEVVKVISMVSV